MTSPAISIRGLSVGYGERRVLDTVDLDIPAGAITVLVGANGCGKSTLLKTVARQLSPSAGSIHVAGQDVTSFSRVQFARRVGFLPQDPVAPEGVSVLELVSRGRHPHRGRWGRWRAQDDAAVAEALELTGLGEHTHRHVTELSGGQRQRVWLALALAQHTDVLLLDEPTTYLDVAHQVDVLEILTDLQRRRGLTLVLVLHELNLAARYADELVALGRGGVLARGSATDVMVEPVVNEIFGIDSRVLHDPDSDSRVVIPWTAPRDASRLGPAQHASAARDSTGLAAARLAAPSSGAAAPSAAAVAGTDPVPRVDAEAAAGGAR